MGISMFKKLSAEFLGTFVLVFGGCGSALFACGVTHGIGYGERSPSSTASSPAR